MSRRKVEGIIWFVAGIILVLLLANKSKMLSDNIGENIFSLDTRKGCGISGTIFKLGNDFDKKFCCSWKTLVGKLY